MNEQSLHGRAAGAVGSLSAGDVERPVRVGLNGFGRIGRNVFRALLTDERVELVGINDVMDPDDAEYLLRHDTVMGRLDGVAVEGEGESATLTFGEESVPFLNVQDPAKLPWGQLGVDVALECTGVFRTREDAAGHLDGGADRVLISAPPKGEPPVDQIVYGVNHADYDGDDVVSAASCTTNSVAPPLQVLDDAFGVERGTLTTVHAYTGSQSLIDGPKGKRRRGRAAAENIVPTSTGAAEATTEVLPQLEGKLDGMAIRVPVPNGSLTELVVALDDDPGVEGINAAMREAADAGPLAGVLGYTDEEIVSSDVLGLPFSSTVDLRSTNRIGDSPSLYKVLTWYDNEFGFSNRMLDVACYVDGY